MVPRRPVTERRMRLFHSPKYFADLGTHIMPIRKFQLVRDAIAAEKLPLELVEPPRCEDVDILRVHTPEYLRAVETGVPLELAQSQKFPWSPALAEAVRWTNGGCVAAMDSALRDGVAGNLASGFHHSHGPHGEGFCTYNGIVISMERARSEGRIQRGLVLDMDLHYGNGTAALIADRPWLHQLSIYGNWYKKNLAYRDVVAERAPDTANAFSVPVPAATNGAGYRALLAEHTSVDVIICDDGLQHLALRRDIEIAVFDARGAGNGRLLLAGPLRERPRRVDAVVCNGGGTPPGQFAMTIEPAGFYRLDDSASRVDVSSLQRMRTVAIAGIGDPQRFFRTLAALDLQPLHTVAFPDHHRFSLADLRFPDCDAIVMTEKDAVKCRSLGSPIPLYALRVDAKIDASFEAHILTLLQSVSSHGRAST